MPSLPNENSSQHSRRKAMLLGVGLDNEDGHVRVTRGEEFTLVGGSHDTHEQMQEKAIKFGEELQRRGKRMADITPKEFLDIADRIRMKEP